MSILMSLTLTMAVVGAAMTALAYGLSPAAAADGPAETLGSGWNFAFIGGISLAGLGALGAMTLLFTI